MPGVRVAARARAGVGGPGRRQRRGAAERVAGTSGRGAAALHGAVRRQRLTHPAPAHRHSPAADGHLAGQNGESPISAFSLVVN